MVTSELPGRPAHIKLLFHRLKIQPLRGITIKLITMQGHQNTTITKGTIISYIEYSSICYIASKIGWVSMREVYKL